MALPLVLVHQNPRAGWYLPYTISQAHASNPHSEVVMIADAPPHLEDCRYVASQAYLEGARALDAIYQNYSPNARDYELFCFQRWFILREWMEHEAVSECFSIDSDMLLYTDVTQDRANYPVAELTYLGGGPLSGFITRPALARFCDFLLRFYADPACTENARRAFETAQQIGGSGISDMTLLQQFLREDTGTFEDVTQVRANSRYDLNINHAEGYTMRGTLKAVQFQGDVPFCEPVVGGEPVRFKSLHFQGEAKLFLSSFVRPRARIKLPFPYRYAGARYRAARLKGRLLARSR